MSATLTTASARRFSQLSKKLQIALASVDDTLQTDLGVSALEERCIPSRPFLWRTSPRVLGVLTVADHHVMGSSILFLELADAVLFLDAEPLAAVHVRTSVIRFDRFPLAVERTSTALLESLLEDRATACAFQF